MSHALAFAGLTSRTAVDAYNAALLLRILQEEGSKVAARMAHSRYLNLGLNMNAQLERTCYWRYNREKATVGFAEDPTDP